MSIDFGGMIRRSFELAWRYKTLWVFGLFAGASGGDFNFDSSKFVNFNEADYRDILECAGLDCLPFSFDEQFIGTLILWVVAMIILFIVCHLIATPALIDGVNKITRGGRYEFGTSFSRGIDFMARYFGLSLIGFAVLMAVIAVVVVLAIVLTPISLLLTIPAMLVAFFFLVHILGLAEVALVARDVSVGDALAEGNSLVMRNIGACFIMTLVLIGLYIGFAIVLGIAALMLYWPINMIVETITQSLTATIVLGLFLGLPIALVLGGYSGTFFSSLYVQFYFQLVEPGPIPALGQPAPPTADSAT
ncbi:MAG: hypothetical protein DRP45_10205 [Candidatus Zixiibacteriota bacterium]|nr:MAG: hypothetical protein DRP45_10205 [candidate division Zixibacteria bacterium]